MEAVCTIKWSRQEGEAKYGCTYSTLSSWPVVDNNFESSCQYTAFTSDLAGEAEIGRNHSGLYGPRIIFSRTILFRKFETNSRRFWDARRLCGLL